MVTYKVVPDFLGCSADLDVGSGESVGLSGFEPGCLSAELYCIGAGTVGWGAETVG